MKRVLWESKYFILTTLSAISLALLIPAVLLFWMGFSGWALIMQLVAVAIFVVDVYWESRL